MNPTRTKILFGIAAVLAIALIWNWISGWGLVTVHVMGQPVSKVVKSIERQGGIKIVTNVAPETVLSMDVDRVPPVEAVDTLAARLGGNWSVGYVAGASKADVATGVASFAGEDRNSGFRTFGFRGGGGFGGFGGGGDMMDPSSTPIDARLVEWKVSPADTPQLQSYLEQLSIKTGLMAAVPESWNPDVSKQPSGGRAGSALKALVSSVKGVYQEVFVLRVQNEERFANAAPQQRPGTDGGFGGPRPDGNNRGPGQGGGPRQFHPEWLQERAEARIAQLPKEEQEQAKRDMDEMRAMWEKIQSLPEEQRRAEVDKIFNSPAVQERMSERMAQRDEKSGPEQRAQRARDYLQRKQAMKESQGSN